ncbi:urease accessory protein UreF [Mangrovihabitans endophyticus]|uniref:Urease accessory protein UreF n=1 Tax=Mangrovihabitans endophyticus TaxID=1751298 RepID=A0A8J3BX24_9ACTN|nr:urease accessory UreF family protein [Mangrovihabitans endophyticus]GGK85820.1 urease accessory protein UreF [Mangrovihabitans endophyticus]
MSLTTLLVLADGRLPAGGHAHSGGLEAAVSSGRVRGMADLDGFLQGRLATAGVVTASFAAAACADPQRWRDLDAGLDARTPSPALRKASRAQGRALMRAGRILWPVPALDRPAAQRIAPHHPVVLGAVAHGAGLVPRDAAVAAAYGTLTGPATAGVRLLGLDPFGAHALLAGLAGACDRIADEAAARAGDPVDTLPAAGAPLLDIGAEQHATWEVRLFAS